MPMSACHMDQLQKVMCDGTCIHSAATEFAPEEPKHIKRDAFTCFSLRFITEADDV